MQNLFISFYRRKKGGRRIAGAMVSILCVCAMVIGNLLPNIPAKYASAAGQPLLANLIINKVYELQPVGEVPQNAEEQINNYGFAPVITDYEGTAYSSVAEIKVYPFVDSDSAAVTVNGQELQGAGYVPIALPENGSYPVSVKVTDNGLSTEYHVEVEKVDHDYRERRAITKNEKIMSALSVQTESGDEDRLLEVLGKDYLVKGIPGAGSGESYWETEEPPRTLAEGVTPTSFTVDLGDVYSVSRIRAIIAPGSLGLGGNRVRISVSTDGEDWKSPVTKGNMYTGTGYHQNVVRYEFGISYDARYIKYEVTDWANASQNLKLYQFMIYTDTGDVPQVQQAPEGGSVPHQHETDHQYLASGQATVIERGYPMSGWTPSSGYGRGVPTPKEAEQFGYDGPLFYDPDFENPDYMLYNPDALWGIAKAPFGGNAMGGAGEPRDFIPQSMKPYINNAISFCFGDEGGYSLSEAEKFGEWYEWTRQHYPGVILHNNQRPSGWSENSLKEYMRIADPDMVSWDNYYWELGQPGRADLENNLRNAARWLLNNRDWKLYRELAYGGIDGTGSQPILFGQYLDTYYLNQPTSVKNMVSNLSVLSGAKWLNFFRVEFQFDHSYLWDEDGTPTRGLLDWGDIIHRIHAIDPQITRLNNDWIMFKVGEAGSVEFRGTDGFRMGNFDSEESREKNAEFGLQEIAVNSLSKAYGGQTGDVVLGYFNTVPGLYESEIEEYFAGASAPRAFMVMNGLADGVSEVIAEIGGKDDDIVARERGSEENTCQQITITTAPEFAEKTLCLVDKDDRDSNGKARIKEVVRDENGSFTISLGGGETNLYFWKLDSSASATSQSEGAYASFAFDGHSGTYWQPEKVSGDGTYYLENKLNNITFNQVTITEKGDAVQGYMVEYQDAADGSWKTLAEPGTVIGAAALVHSPKAVTASAVRLRITAADGLPAVYEVTLENTEEDPNAEHVVSVNDNTMGTGLNRFVYDDMWSYREAEDGSGQPALFPLEGDGHFSNYSNAAAEFKFYGTKVELKLRANQAQNIKARLCDDQGNMISEKNGVQNNGSIVFDGLEQGAYTLKILKLDTTNQAGIDGAVVTYTGQIPEELLEAEKTEPGGEQVYLNQNSKNASSDNYFEYAPEPSVQNPAQTGEWAADAEGWVEHVQNVENHNIGFTRTGKAGSSYTIHFYGTGIQLFSSSLPVNGKNYSYGDLSFALDGAELPEAAYKNVNRPGAQVTANANISVRVFEVQAEDTSVNAPHTLKVTVNDGYNRIDYAVVNRYREESGQGKYKVTVETGEHGTAAAQADTVEAGGSAVVEITPDPGWQTAKILVHNVSVPVPEDGRLVIRNVREDTVIRITFQLAFYDIFVEDIQGGAVVPGVMRAHEGDIVTLIPDPSAGMRLKEGTLKVIDGQGRETDTVPEADGRYRFTMPASEVTVKAQFEQIPYDIVIPDGITGGRLLTDPAECAVLRQTVTVTVQPEDGWRLTEGSLKAGLEDGSSLMLDAAGEPGTFTFVMPAQTVTLNASFEKIPDFRITADQVENGKTEIEKPEVNAGEDVQVSFLPEEGYRLGALLLNGEPWYLPAGDTLILENICCDIHITPVFAAENTAMLNAKAYTGDTEGGSVAPAQQPVMENGNAVVFISAFPGYYIQDILVNGTSYEEAPARDAQEEGRVTVSENAAALNRYEETLSAGMGTVSSNAGAVSGGDTHDSAAGQELFSACSLSGFGKEMRLVVSAVTADLDIEVLFARDDYQITVEPAENGMLQVSSTSAPMGEKVTVTAVPAEGFRLAGESLKAVVDENKLLNLSAVEEGKSYTFIMPRGDVKVMASFEKVPKPAMEYQIHAEPAENGQLSVSTITSAAGNEVTVTVQPAAGFRLMQGSLKAMAGDTEVDLTEAEAGRSYKFIMPEGEVKVTASFEKVPETTPDPDDNSGDGSEGGQASSPDSGQEPAGTNDDGTRKSPATDTAGIGAVPVAVSLLSVAAAIVSFSCYCCFKKKEEE